jgi:signal transduction histidine kinase
MKSAKIEKDLLVKELEALRQNAAELEKLKAEYQRKTKTLLQVEEEERRSIVREIHDDLSQPLTALKIHLSWLRTRIPKAGKPLLEKVEQISGLTDSITRSVKRISAELRPGVLDDLGLTEAIEWYVGYFGERTGIECELGLEPEEITVDGQLSTAIFRILQKVLTNIPEQASATRVRISLRRRTDKLHLKVTDNSEGTTQEQIFKRQSSGLMEVGERVRLFGGEINIRRNPNRGTTITVTIPLEQNRLLKK